MYKNTQHWILFVFYIFTNLMAQKWYLIFACIFLFTGEAENIYQPFVYLPPNCLLISYDYLSFGLFVFFLIFYLFCYKCSIFNFMKPNLAEFSYRSFQGLFRKNIPIRVLSQGYKIFSHVFSCAFIVLYITFVLLTNYFYLWPEVEI